MMRRLNLKTYSGIGDKIFSKFLNYLIHFLCDAFVDLGNSIWKCALLISIGKKTFLSCIKPSEA